MSARCKGSLGPRRPVTSSVGGPKRGVEPKGTLDQRVQRTPVKKEKMCQTVR